MLCGAVIIGMSNDFIKNNAKKKFANLNILFIFVRVNLIDV